MYQIPTTDMLEGVHPFPGNYVFKVIGKASPGFLAQVVGTVRDALQLEEDPPYSLRETPNGKHVSVTVQPLVQTPDQVILIYQRLQTVVGVVLIL